MTDYPDLMIDIEAYADLPDSAPAEIGLVFFDKDDAEKGLYLLGYHPCPLDAIRLGFSVTTSTLRWWAEKGMPIDFYQGAKLSSTLEQIAAAINKHGRKGMRVWSRGNSYDLAILKLAYNRTAIEVPWDFWMERDVRTYLEVCNYKSERKNNHDALDDAENQALDIIHATQCIGRPRYAAIDVQGDGIKGVMALDRLGDQYPLGVPPYPQLIDVPPPHQLTAHEE